MFKKLSLALLFSLFPVDALLADTSGSPVVVTVTPSGSFVDPKDNPEMKIAGSGETQEAISAALAASESNPSKTLDLAQLITLPLPSARPIVTDPVPTRRLNSVVVILKSPAPPNTPMVWPVVMGWRRTLPATRRLVACAPGTTSMRRN